MQRRKALIGSAMLAGASAANVLAQTKGSGKRFGDVVIPPEKEMGKEKHVPIIEVPSRVKAGEPFTVTVEVGKTVPHPNTVEHHIKWIQLFAIEEGSQYVIQLGSYEFFPAYGYPKVTVPIMLKRNAALYALEHCNIHGIWDYTIEVKVE